MKEFGALLIINGLVVTAYFIISKVPGWTALAFGGLVCFIGAVCVVSDRLEVLELFKIGRLATRAETDADSIAALRSEMEQQVNAAKKEIGGVKTMAEEATSAVGQLKNVQEFSTLILKAQAGQLAAFEELVQISRKDSDFASLAKGIVDEITTSHLLRMQDVDVRIDKKSVGLPDDAKLSDYQRVYDAQDGIGRIAIQNELVSVGNIPPETVDHLVSLLDSENTVLGYFNVAKILKRVVTGEEWNGYDENDAERLKQAWKKKRPEFTASYKYAIEQETKAREEEERERQRVRGYFEARERINGALIAKGFREFQFDTPRDIRQSTDLSQVGINFIGRFGIKGTADDLVAKIEAAETLDDLNPNAKKASDTDPDKSETR